MKPTLQAYDRIYGEHNWLFPIRWLNPWELGFFRKDDKFYTRCWMGDDATLHMSFDAYNELAIDEGGASWLGKFGKVGQPG